MARGVISSGRQSENVGKVFVVGKGFRGKSVVESSPCLRRTCLEPILMEEVIVKVARS